MSNEYNEFNINIRRSLPFQSNPDRDINILLIGETGVGKTTFINALANYLTYDNLRGAMNGKMQVLIPSIFSVADVETHELRSISVGTPNKNEICIENGQSQTQGCKSYLFAIGNRYLRLIDTPGIGDTRGVERDNMNFADVLTYISRYKHLNAICILLKPNDNRLTISFRYIIKEVLKHLHVNAKENIMFIFTNGRSNLYAPGATAVQLNILLKDLKNNTTHDVPFVRENTFIFDNEPYRFLAVYKAGYDIYMNVIETFQDSWSRSVDELQRLIKKIVRCNLHPIQLMESLNEAEQIILTLNRPISEVATILEQNIQLAEKHKKKLVYHGQDDTSHQLPENKAEIISLRYPRTICTSEKCSKVIKINNEMKIEYEINCHERCHLKGIEQEVINNPALQHCKAIDKQTGKCKRCNCDWSKHMHVTYEFRKSLSFIDLEEKSFDRLISSIDKRIARLKQEQEYIQFISVRLVIFLRANSINPMNDDIIEYINHFIREEKRKLIAGNDSQQIIHGLEKLIDDYRAKIEFLTKTTNEYDSNECDERNTIPTLNEIFVYKTQLCELPITGKYIREQINSLKQNKKNMIYDQDEYIELPQETNYSSSMQKLKEIIT